MTEEPNRSGGDLASPMESVREGGKGRVARSAAMSLKPKNLRERRESLQLHGETKNGRGLRRKNSSGRSLERIKMWMAAAWWTMRITCRRIPSLHLPEDGPHHQVCRTPCKAVAVSVRKGDMNGRTDRSM